MENIEKYLTEKNKEIGVICKMDSAGNEHSHRFFLVDKGCEHPDSVADKLEIMKMEDVAIWKEDVAGAMELGLKTCNAFYNFMP